MGAHGTECVSVVVALLTQTMLRARTFARVSNNNRIPTQSVWWARVSKVYGHGAHSNKGGVD